MKHFYFLLLFAVSLIILVSTLAFVNNEKEIPHSHLEVVLRNIGHQLLLHSKDSTSRVLPVKTINERIYQISFENSFGFTPDSLMNLVQQQLLKTDMPRDYIVSVNDCYENKTIFAYEINTAEGNLKPCRERKQEKGCYLIQIEFLAKKSFNYAWLFTAFIPLTFISLYFYPKKSKHKTEEPKKQENVGDQEHIHNNEQTVPDVLEYIQLGQFQFFEAKGMLLLGDTTIQLSEKEIKAVSIFASNQNVVVERERLMKEIWEAEGVVVIDRNVDVMISKLRKKLMGDPSIKIVNVHGKGYKCMTV